MTDYVYVPIEGMTTSDGNIAPGTNPEEPVEYAYSVGDDNWTTDPMRHRNHYDSEGAEYLRVEKAWAEEQSNLRPPGSFSEEEGDGE